MNDPDLLKRQDALFQLFDQRMTRFETGIERRVAGLESKIQRLRDMADARDHAQGTSATPKKDRD